METQQQEPTTGANVVSETSILPTGQQVTVELPLVAAQPGIWVADQISPYGNHILNGRSALIKADDRAPFSNAHALLSEANRIRDGVADEVGGHVLVVGTGLLVHGILGLGCRALAPPRGDRMRW